MNASRIRRAAHQPIQRIDLAHQVALADAADRRVAGHLADRLDAMGQQQRPRSDARGRRGCLAPGMSAADHHHIEMLSHTTHTLLAAGRVAL